MIPFFWLQDFTSQNLIECLSKYFDEDMQHLNVSDYIIFCKACAKADYKPANWETTILSTLKTFKFDFYLNQLNIDWAEFVLMLDKLGYCDTRLIRKLLKSNYSFNNPKQEDKLIQILLRNGTSPAKEFTEDTDTNSVSDSEEVTMEETNDESQLYRDLTNMFGAHKICSNVRIDRNLFVPYVLKIDLESGEFLPITKASQNIDSKELL